jgi:hypothetical protein
MPSFTIASHPSGRLDITLLGAFDEPDALELERQLTQDRGGARSSVFFDLRQLESCTILARSVLARIQKDVVAPSARRTAYVADRSLFRGLALWITHVSEDENAKTVATDEQAQEWLSSSASRVADLQERMGRSVERAKQSHKRGDS